MLTPRGMITPPSSTGYFFESCILEITDLSWRQHRTPDKRGFPEPPLALARKT
jgi:hypothetical protein